MEQLNMRLNVEDYKTAIAVRAIRTFPPEWGYRRIWRVMNDAGLKVSQKWVANELNLIERIPNAKLGLHQGGSGRLEWDGYTFYLSDFGLEIEEV
jgi:hypothetical protein